jgi:hypothetical protein
MTAQDGSIHLLRNGEHSWTREESLSHILPGQTLFLDLPVPEPKTQLHVSSKNLLGAYVQRVTTHIKQLRNLPSGLVTFARHFATGQYEEIEIGSHNRDAFGLRKFIVVGTGTEKLVALDSANGGDLVWSLLVGRSVKGMRVLRESSAVRGQPPVIGVLVEKDGSCQFLQVNGLDGTILEEEVDVGTGEIVKTFLAPVGVVDSQGRRGLVVVTKKGDVKILPEGKDIYNAAAKFDDNFYYSIHEGDIVSGYFLDYKVLPSSN